MRLFVHSRRAIRRESLSAPMRIAKSIPSSMMSTKRLVSDRSIVNSGKRPSNSSSNGVM